MSGEPGALTVIANKLRIAFKISKDPDFIASKEKIWGWKANIKTLNDGYEALGDCREGLSIQDVSQIVLKHQGTDEELIDKIMVDKQKDWHGNWSNIKKSVSGIIAICQPNALLVATKSVFENEQVKTFSNEHKKLILESYFYPHIGEGFAEGMGSLVDICKSNKDHLPQDIATQLAEFMTNSPAFKIFFEARQNDLDEDGRKGRIAPTFLYDLVETASGTEEKRKIKSIFDSNYVFSQALGNEIRFIEDRDNRTVDRGVYLR